MFELLQNWGTYFHHNLSSYLFWAGCAHFSILCASALVPLRLNWKQDLACLPTLHRQMYWVYAAYVVLSIIAFGLISVVAATELAQGSLLARAFCGYVAVFWGIRLGLQWVFDVKQHLNTWWLQLGYHGLSLLFLCLCSIYLFAALYT